MKVKSEGVTSGPTSSEPCALPTFLSPYRKYCSWCELYNANDLSQHFSTFSFFYATVCDVRPLYDFYSTNVFVCLKKWFAVH